MTARINAIPSLRLIGALAIVVAAVAVPLWWFVARSAADVEVAGQGLVTVADSVYNFELTTCTAANSDFVAAGYGIVDGERYWLNASGAGVDITAGTESEIEPPVAGHLWLSSNSPPEWTVTNGVVDAEVAVTDRRSPGSTTSLAVLRLNCHPRIPGDA